jgi:hypothetical protein
MSKSVPVTIAREEEKRAKARPGISCGGWRDPQADEQEDQPQRGGSAGAR